MEAKFLKRCKQFHDNDNNDTESSSQQTVQEQGESAMLQRLEECLSSTLNGYLDGLKMDMAGVLLTLLIATVKQRMLQVATSLLLTLMVTVP